MFCTPNLEASNPMYLNPSSLLLANKPSLCSLSSDKDVRSEIPPPNLSFLINSFICACVAFMLLLLKLLKVESISSSVIFISFTSKGVRNLFFVSDLTADFGIVTIATLVSNLASKCSFLFFIIALSFASPT